VKEKRLIGTSDFQIVSFLEVVLERNFASGRLLVEL